MMIMLQTWQDEWYGPLDVDWLRYVARNRDVLLLNDGHVPNFLHENWDFLLDRNLLNFSVIPIVDVISRPAIVLHQFVDLFLDALALLGHDSLRCDCTEDHHKQHHCLELLCGESETMRSDGAIKWKKIY